MPTAFDPAVLAKALSQPLPGVEAQLQLAHPARSFTAPEGIEPREAGVLVLVYPTATGEHFPLIVRTSHNPNDKHRGQISLPGGKREKSDASIEATALREAEEEVGVDASRVTVLGRLSTLYIPVSNFNVYPTVGFIEEIPKWVPQVSEVARVIEAPLGRLNQTDVVQHTEMPLGDKVKLRNVPYFDIEGEVVWGATAMILSELRQLLAV
ncbi:MAG: CoA pyrophosphatase [Saprospiraceae bacterium]